MPVGVLGLRVRVGDSGTGAQGRALVASGGPGHVIGEE
jgi:hypothetical protein